MENLLLSADSDIGLYKVKKELLERLDSLCEDFYKWKKTDCFDETLFVKFLKSKYGNDSIEFIKIVGQCGAGDFNEELDKFEDVIQDEYKNLKWIKF